MEPIEKTKKGGELDLHLHIHSLKLGVLPIFRL